jgi:glycosyltransferase involved in cell wall biosynthesis
MTTGSHTVSSDPSDTCRRICIVGAGTYFLSGISYYTLHLSNELSQTTNVCVILLRKLLPVRLYPGRKRAGTTLTSMQFNQRIYVFDGIDWFWGINMVKSLAFLVRRRPDVLLFQWWTGTVLHTYLALALIGKLVGARIIVEFHEVIATEEGRMRWAALYVTWFAPLFMRLADAFVIHSEYDRGHLEKTYPIGKRHVAVIPVGPFSHYQAPEAKGTQRSLASNCCNLLFFGVIRPYKGLEDLVAAYNNIPEDEIANYWLTVVGETWEGWTLPTHLIETSKYRDRITFVNRYVTDEEATTFFRHADVVVLPYHRSSASGPLHVAMSQGLPVVVTHVGGLVEAAGDYAGALFVPPHDHHALQEAIKRACALTGQRFNDPHSWQQSIERYEDLIDQLG